MKHYLGLKRAQQNDPRQVTLLYLYWEPMNTQAEAFTKHRLEAAEFKERARDRRVRFHSMSYTELWAKWERAAASDRVNDHLARLRDRYSVSLR